MSETLFFFWNKERDTLIKHESRANASTNHYLKTRQRQIKIKRWHRRTLVYIRKTGFQWESNPTKSIGKISGFLLRNREALPRAKETLRRWKRWCVVVFSSFPGQTDFPTKVPSSFLLCIVNPQQKQGLPGKVYQASDRNVALTRSCKNTKKKINDRN